LVGAPLTGELLAKVDGRLEKELPLHRTFHTKNNQVYFYFSLGGPGYNLTQKDVEAIPEPSKARVIVTLDQGRPGAIEIKQGRVRQRIKYVVVRNERGEIDNVSPRNPFHRPEGVEKGGGGTQIVEGFFSRLIQGPNGAGGVVSFEELYFFGAQQRLRRLSREQADRFSPGRFSFLVHNGQIQYLCQTEQLTPAQLNMLKIRAYYLTEWQGKAVPEAGFYCDLLAQSPARDRSQEGKWQTRFFSRIQGLLDSGGTPMPAGADHKQAAALLFALEYMLTGKSDMLAKKVQANGHKVLPLVAALGEERFAQAAAWLWSFPETQPVLLGVLPYLDIRDRHFGPQIMGAFNRDPFLWDQVFRKLF
jgi:hypothetical protein